MKKTINISIGEFYVSREPSVIYTLLGSCVAACLFDPKNRIGGMNHILMPGRATMDKYDTPARFGVNAMELLINALMKLGAERSQIVGKVFGGASVIPGIAKGNAIGHKNVRFAIEFMEQERIKLINSDLGGIHTRKIFFDTANGDVFLKRSRSIKSSQMAAEEQKKLIQIHNKMKAPTDITIF